MLDISFGGSCQMQNLKINTIATHWTRLLYVKNYKVMRFQFQAGNTNFQHRSQQKGAPSISVLLAIIQLIHLIINLFVNLTL